MKNAITDLESVHKSMMAWMQNFGEVFSYKEDRLEGMNENQIKESIEQMKEQHDAVNAMKEEMESSMENAQTILAN